MAQGFEAPVNCVFAATIDQTEISRQRVLGALNRLYVKYPLLGMGVSLEHQHGPHFIERQPDFTGQVCVGEYHCEDEICAVFDNEVKRRFVREHDPYVFCRVLRGEKSSVVFFTVHHVISDGFSGCALFFDFLRLLLDPDKKFQPGSIARAVHELQGLRWRKAPFSIIKSWYAALQFKIWQRQLKFSQRGSPSIRYDGQYMLDGILSANIANTISKYRRTRKISQIALYAAIAAKSYAQATNSDRLRLGLPHSYQHQIARLPANQIGVYTDIVRLDIKNLISRSTSEVVNDISAQIKEKRPTIDQIVGFINFTSSHTEQVLFDGNCADEQVDIVVTCLGKINTPKDLKKMGVLKQYTPRVTIMHKLYFGIGVTDDELRFFCGAANSLIPDDLVKSFKERLEENCALLIANS